jgi:4-hydroxybenzoate polyprenyltransferase
LEWFWQWLAGWAQHTQVHYGVNPWIFGVLWFGTWPPYVYAWIRLARSIKEKRAEKIRFWVTMVALIFIVPYAYVALAGKNLPPSFWVFLSIFVGLLGWQAVGKYLRMRRAQV